SLADDTSLPLEQRSAAGFALGKLLDDAELLDQAFAAFARANALYRDARAAAGERFDATALGREVDAAIATFTPEFFAAVSGWGEPVALPTFVLGMPRSGTSLVEQIAASHSRVSGMGELSEIGRLAAELGPPLDQ